MSAAASPVLSDLAQATVLDDVATTETDASHSPAEPSFARLTSLAAYCVGAPAAALSIVGPDAGWTTTVHGDLPALAQACVEPPSRWPWGDVTTCDEPRLVSDVSTDWRTYSVASAAVLDPDVRAYLSVPVADPTGQPLGVLCAMDIVPRAWSASDVAALGAVAAAVAGEIALRRERAARREHETRFRTLLATVRGAAVTLDARATVTFANEPFLALTGWSREETVGTNWFDQFVPSGEAAKRRFCELIARGEVPAHSTYEIATRDGDRCVVAWDSTPLRDADGTPVGVACVGQDVTERRAFEARLALLVEHDDLTGLHNRRGFRRMAAHAMKSASRTARRDGVLRLDIDQLDAIRDEHGHADADDALSEVAEVVQRTTRGSDVAGRIGDAQFAICAVGLREPGDVHVLAARLDAALAAHNRAAAATGRPYEVAYSIGVADVEFGDDIDHALARAAAALEEHRVARFD